MYLVLVAFEELDPGSETYKEKGERFRGRTGSIRGGGGGGRAERVRKEKKKRGKGLFFSRKRLKGHP